MKKKYAIIANIIIWPVAILFLFFSNSITTQYFRVINGTELHFGNSKYELSQSSYLMGSVVENEFSIGLNVGDIKYIYVTKTDNYKIESMLKVFSSTLTKLEQSNCVFFVNTGGDPNLPILSWYRKEDGLYFKMLGDEVIEYDYPLLCSLLKRKEHKTSRIKGVAH